MKTKALISFAVTAKLICVFVFAYAKSRFSHDEAQLSQFSMKAAHKNASAELPDEDNSNEYPQHRFSWTNNQNNSLIIIKYEPYEPRCEKNGLRGFDMVPHKPGCTDIEEG